MSVGINPCLNLAIDRLIQAGSEHFAIWVLDAPLPGGYGHHDSTWSLELTQKWLAWQSLFSLQPEPHLPIANIDNLSLQPLNKEDLNISYPRAGYSGRLMQDLGVSLWKWLFDGEIRHSFEQSRGMAIGQNKPLRLRLDIRDPHLIPLPWEIMQPEAGKQAISLNQQILFSRTTSDVDPLCFQNTQEELNILLVLGQEISNQNTNESTSRLQLFRFNATTLPDDKFAENLELEAEANALVRVIAENSHTDDNLNPWSNIVSSRVDILVKPSPTELIDTLGTGIYNIFFYAGHGIPAPDGGLLFLQPEATINGTELAQILVQNQVTLAVFNACWGAQPDQKGQTTIPRSSLAEVLIHHGVPAVLGMRDSIADQEALAFIQAFTRALAERKPIDQAVAIARQQLLTLYKFNQPAWTLPILYMHPEFDGELIKGNNDSITELPVLTKEYMPGAYLRSLENPEKIWRIRGGLMRIGRRLENDIVIPEKWVSQNHADIFCRDDNSESMQESCYFIKDFSRYGTWLKTERGWRKIHHQELRLDSGVQLKFGSTYGQVLEFIIEY